MRTLIATTTALTLSLALSATADMRPDSPFSYTPTGQEIAASNFIGARVYTSRSDVSNEISWTNWDGSTSDWNDIGEIHDVLMSRDGEIEAILVDVGGFLGIGEKQVAISMDELRFRSDGEASDDYFIVFTSSRAELDAAPEYRPAPEQAAFLGTQDRETSYTGDMSNVGAAAVPEMPASDVLREDFEETSVSELDADDLTGARVYDAQDNWIGEIGKLNLGTDGSIDEAVIDVGGFLGIGEKPVALKFDVLDVQKQTGGEEIRVFLDVTREGLMEMPAYEG